MSDIETQRENKSTSRQVQNKNDKNLVSSGYFCGASYRIESHCIVLYRHTHTHTHTQIQEIREYTTLYVSVVVVLCFHL